MKNRLQFWALTSLATIVVGLLIILVVRPVWGIDFTGGSLLEIRVGEASLEQVRAEAEQVLETVSVQAGEDQAVLLKTTPLDATAHQELVAALREAGVLEEELRFESIGPTIGAELRQKALIAIVVVVAVLIVYLRYTFRQAADLIAPWRFGLAAVYALIHDLVVVLAVFVILGRVAGVPIDTLFVTAMLAILGYSVNDTIVIFNRLRFEWLQKRGTLQETLDRAVRASLVRSLNTSLTTLLVLGALLFFGGSTIRWFVVALTIGTAVGTYSSLLVAPPILYYLARRS